MKILIDARLYGLENTGLGRYVINLVGGLSKLDSQNEYLILLRKKYFDSLIFPDNWKKVLANSHHYSWQEQIEIPQIIKKEKPDLSHFPHFNVPLLFKGEYVVTIHDLLMHKGMSFEATTLHPIQYLIKRIGYRLVFDNAVKNALRVIVPSMAIGQEVSDIYKIDKNKINVTYEGMDSNISQKDKIKIDKPYFAYIGNAYPHKNLGRLIKAVKILNTKSNHKAILAISGARNIFTQRMKSMIKKENSDKYIKLLGFIPDEKLGSFLSEATAYTFPTLSEGFGLPGLEAMASGTLLLASDIPVLREIYKDNAIYFDSMNPKSIAEVLEKSLVMSPKERMVRIKKAKEFVKIYSWDKMAKETLKIYESCNSIRPGK